MQNNKIHLKLTSHFNSQNKHFVKDNIPSTTTIILNTQQLILFKTLLPDFFLYILPNTHTSHFYTIAEPIEKVLYKNYVNKFYALIAFKVTEACDEVLINIKT